MTNSTGLAHVALPKALTLDRFFEGVPSEVRSAVMESAQSIKLGERESLFEQGDRGDSMFFVQHGRIEISIVSEQGRKVVLNQISSGLCFGEISMVDGQQRTAAAVAIEPSVVLPITRAAFLKAVNNCPQLAVNISVILCERLRWVSTAVEEYALLAIDVRLARRLISLAASFGDGKGSVTITQNDLADFIGATRESTNKVLMHWKSQGIVDLKRGKIQILQASALEHVANGAF